MRGLPLAKLRVLCEDKLYENGECLGPLKLEEGQRSDPLVLMDYSAIGQYQLEESSGVSDIQKTLSESSGKKVLLVLEGIFQRADSKNANNRIYPDKVWDKFCSPGSKQKKWAESGEMLGECDHPKDGETLLQRVVCMTTDFYRSPGNSKEILGRMVVFDTVQGRNLKAMHDGGARLGVSSRGKGSLVRVDGVDVVQEDYELETWDIVYNPSTPGAYPKSVTEVEMAHNEIKETSSAEVLQQLKIADPVAGQAVTKDMQKTEPLELPPGQTALPNPHPEKADPGHPDSETNDKVEPGDGTHDQVPVKHEEPKADESAIREAAIDECTARFQSIVDLYESRIAVLTSTLSSALDEQKNIEYKLDGSKKVLEVLRSEVLDLRYKLSESENTTQAATTILEALTEEVRLESVRGAVGALAAIHSNLTGLAESLSKATSVTDAVRIVQSVSESSKEPEHKPVINGASASVRESALAEALKLSAKVEKTLTEKMDERPEIPQRRDPILEATQRIMKTMKSKGLN